MEIRQSIYNASSYAFTVGGALAFGWTRLPGHREDFPSIISDHIGNFGEPAAAAIGANAARALFHLSAHERDSQFLKVAGDIVHITALLLAAYANLWIESVTPNNMEAGGDLIVGFLTLLAVNKAAGDATGRIIKPQLTSDFTQY
jgi:hypothetical protein